MGETMVQAKKPIQPNGTKKKGLTSRQKKRLLFYSCFICIPLLQFLVFYIYVNFNSIALAFQSYEAKTGMTGYTVTFAGFENFKTAFTILGENIFMIKNSAIMFVCSTLVGLSLALLLSFYLYKRFPAAGFFKVILFMPQILSHVVFALIFAKIGDELIPDIFEKLSGEQIMGVMTNPDTNFGVLIIFNLWIGFGVNVLLFQGAMEGINPSVVESAQLDGVNLMQEFFHITIPLIFPTFVTFLVLGLAGIFTNQMNLFSLYGTSADAHLQTFGYFMYMQSLKSDIVASYGFYSYSELSALGLVLTLIVFPITFGTRKLLEKFGPSTD